MNGEAEESMICVVGSINIDLVCRVAEIPRPGETTLATGYAQYHGGKGANQAVAAARAGGKVQMVGAVGADHFGKLALANLDENKVNTDTISVTDDATGCAFITVSESGENAITVASGANLAVIPTIPESARILITQMELPIPTTLKAMELAKKTGGKTILNFAPVPTVITRDMLDALVAVTDVLIVNEHELAALCMILDIANDGAALARNAQCQTIVTSGAAGISVHDPRAPDAPFLAKPPQVEVVDTTGAGDTFVGVLAARLHFGDDMRTAAFWAMCAATLACRSMGAQSAMPELPEIAAAVRIADAPRLATRWHDRP
jgi:ribokinase